MADVTLEFLAKKVDEVLREQADFRDQLIVLTAICMRVESALQALTTEVRAMHSRHSRLVRRVSELERNSQVED